MIPEKSVSSALNQTRSMSSLVRLSQNFFTEKSFSSLNKGQLKLAGTSIKFALGYGCS
jgi:hypothetical protein